MPQRFRAIFESAVDFAIIASDRNGLITDWNPGAEKVLGWSADEMRGQAAERFFTPEDREVGRPAEEMRIALAEGRASDERWHVRRDGSRFFAVGEMTPLRDEAGEHIGFLKILTDRTAEQEARAALVASQADLHRAQEAGGVGLFSLDIASNVLRVTPEFCRLFGLPTREAYPAEEIETLFLRDGTGAEHSTIESRRDGSLKLDVEYRIRRADTGEVRWIARRAEIERDASGAPLRIVGVAWDATERRQIEEELRDANARLQEREAFLSSVLAASTDCIKVLDLEGRLTFMSEGGMKVMEVSDFNAIEGCPWPELLTGAGSDAARDAIAAAREGRESHFEMAAQTFLGTPRWWDVSVSPIRGAEGEVARILSVSRDRTALRQAQEQQEIVNREISHRLKNTMAMVQAIVAQTLRGVADRAPVEALTDRLHALAAAHDTLLESGWRVADLGEVARGVLDPFDRSGRVRLAGPPVDLGARAAQSLALLLHELGTNALKYGALSSPEGAVDLTWAVEERDGTPTLGLDWRERGGPPVAPPQGQGFGSRLVRMGLLGTGSTVVRFNSEGVEVAFSAPLALLQQS